MRIFSILLQLARALALLTIFGWLLSPCGAELGIVGDEKSSEHSVDLLAAQALSGNMFSRAQTIWQLAQFDDSTDALLDVLRHADAETRPYVAISLGWQGAKAVKAAGALLPLLAEKSPLTQSTAAWALGRLGDPSAGAALQPLLKSDDELTRYLAEEAIGKLQGKDGGQDYRAPRALTRPLQGATILHVGDLSVQAADYLFAAAVGDKDIKWKAIGVNSFNPAMGYLGGMPAESEEAFSRLLAFKDGRPQVDIVLIDDLYPTELSLRLRWELWQYVRRGGKLIVCTMLLRPMRGAGENTGGSLSRYDFSWKASIFDSLLPKTIKHCNLPFMDGQLSPARDIQFGDLNLGRGKVVLYDMFRGEPADAAPQRITDMEKTEHQIWRHLVRGYALGADRLLDPGLWRQLFTWVLEGPQVFRAGLDMGKFPALTAGNTAKFSAAVKNYQLPDGHLQFVVSLLSTSGKVLATAQDDALAPAGGDPVPALVSLPLPLGTIDEHESIHVALRDVAGKELSGYSFPVQITPVLHASLTAPDEFTGTGKPLRATAKITKTTTRGLDNASVVVSITDIHLRPLLRQQQPWKEGAEYSFEFNPYCLPPGGYQWLLELKQGDEPLCNATALLRRMKPWDFRDALVVLPWGFGGLPPRAVYDELGTIGLSYFDLPAKEGKWTWSVYSPPFVPYGKWPADILAGKCGEEWRGLGTTQARHPFFTCTDTTEESDLVDGSSVFPVQDIGDVEREGHEQYRIFLKQKYHTLEALNRAWATQYVDWSEIRLLGPDFVTKNDVTYTARMGGGGGQMMPVPEKLDPAHGIRSFAPYTDQNDWRWQYIWELLEIRELAYHQTDPYHGLTPGGAMGLCGPFDIPTMRIYAGNSLSMLGLRATIGRETYGLTPHTILIGLAETEAENSKMIWTALAGGGRLITVYAPGDNYGVPMLHGDHTLTEAGKALGRALAPILARQEVLLATHNAISHDVLFLSSGAGLWDCPLSAELFDSLLSSGVLVDFGTHPEEHKVVICAPSQVDPPLLQRLQAFLAAGGTLLALPETAPEMLEKYGLQAGSAAAAGFIGKVLLNDNAPGAALHGLAFASCWRKTLTASGEWKTLGVYADGQPALLSRAVGAGRLIFCNFRYRYDANLNLLGEATSINDENDALRQKAAALLTNRYARGNPVRSEAEVYRRLLSGLLEGAGVTGNCRTVDTDGSAIPYVDAEMLETGVETQRYLIVFADHRLPAGVTTAAGMLHIDVPGVRAVYDTFSEHLLPFADRQVPFKLEPGRGTVLSLLTEDLAGLTLTPEVTACSPGAPLRLKVQLHRTDGALSACEHACNVSVFGPDGKEIVTLRAHFSFTGEGVVAICPSLADPDGAWRIVAHDLTSGQQAEATVSKQNTPPAPPPFAPTAAFRPQAPALALSCPQLNLTGTLNFVPVDATLCSSLPRPVTVKVALDIPHECLLNGAGERSITLTPEHPQETLHWEVAVNREQAVAFYYSAMPRGFRTDYVRPEQTRYSDGALPAFKLSVAGEPLELTFNDKQLTAQREFSCHLPLQVMPFAQRPPQLGPLHGEALALRFNNQLGRPLAGSVQITPAPWMAALPRQEVKLAANSEQELSLTPSVSAGKTASPGLYELPVSFSLGEQHLEAGARVELVYQRQWLTWSGPYFAGQQEDLPIGEDGAPVDPTKWTTAIGDTVLPVDALLQKAEQAYAYTRIYSPDEREVRLRLPLIGAEARLWINGNEESFGRKKDQPPLTAAGQLTIFPSRLHKGWNTCVFALHRLDKRCVAPTLTITAKDGTPIGDLQYLATEKVEK